jgi:S-formylglutathione hydrolase
MKSLAFLFILLAPISVAESREAPKSKLNVLTVHSAGLVGNAFGDSADQQVAVYLPPGYDQGSQRFPVIYLLHGIGDSYEDWTNFFEVPATLDRLIGGGKISPVIAVMPNSRSRFLGSYYTNSPINGRWEDYVANDVVAVIDKTYRTLAKRESRALAGHSMGGFGAISVGMHRSDVFSVVYAISPCCLEMVEDIGMGNDAAYREFFTFKSYEDADAALKRGHFYPVALLAMLSALVPNPDAPLKVDVPVQPDRFQFMPAHPAYERFRDAFPVRRVPMYADNLRKLSLLQIEYGFDDQYAHIPVATRNLSLALIDNRVPHVIDVYDGEHRSRVKERLESKIFPILANQLARFQ